MIYCCLMTTQFQIYLSNCIHIVKAIFITTIFFYIAVIITVLKNSISTFNINDLIEQYRILKNKYHIQKITYEHKNNQKLIIP